MAFVPVSIPADAYQRVVAGLKDAEDCGAIRRVFATALQEDEPIRAPTFDEASQAMKELSDAIREQNKVMTWRGYP